MFWAHVYGPVSVAVPEVPFLSGEDGLSAAPAPDTALLDRDCVSVAPVLVGAVISALRCCAALVPCAAAAVDGGFAAERAGASRFIRQPSTLELE